MAKPSAYRCALSSDFEEVIGSGVSNEIQSAEGSESSLLALYA